ncbi:CBS domain protein [Candidatus Endolissoclinum faulkneri L5]|uniref:CBS domain protein n=1 Tax=Candidatus Endolissoclinum faulkneri L5 TaxID=1401328 RepID=V9TW05_9PROT|nr:HlyC/CorC family transporter [Candidatus Endolissoclinum faulkneri]AHC73510.1 CBS domain protein [Candidatus Endolissoclinum faulkneri L5]
MNLYSIIDTDIEIPITICTIAFLILLSGFFSGSETALTTASKARLSQLARKGSSRAATVIDLKDKSDSLIGAILIGNNIANILASALATSTMVALVGESGVLIASIAMTVFAVIFSEMLPKTYAINNPDKMALFVGPLVSSLVFVLTPFTWVTRIIVEGMLKLFGISPFSSRLAHDDREEELRGLIEMHDDGGEDFNHERAMLRSILDLADVEVEEIMTHRSAVCMINAEAPVDKLFAEVLKSSFTRLPLYRADQDSIVGVLHVNDLLRLASCNTKEMIPENFDVMTIAANPWVILNNTTLLDQLQAFRTRGEHFAVVVDKHGSFMGVVTLEDILEEIVGDILDEKDRDVLGVCPQADGSYIVQGSMTIRDLNREFNWNLPYGEASTVAGIVLYESRKIPEVGQKFSFHGFCFLVLRRHRNQITLLRMTPIHP